MNNNHSKLVSILVPAYNAEKYLSQCLESIVNQTYPYIQVVIVDDGSKDNTLAIAQQFAKEYSFVEVYRQSNLGVAATRNKLLSLAKGDYILFVDCDDWIESFMLERMLSLKLRYNVDIVSCGFFMDYKEISKYCSFVKDNVLLVGEDKIKRALLEHKILTGSLCNKILPKTLCEDLLFRKDIWYGEDCLFLWHILTKGVKKIYITRECFYHYRMNECSISHAHFNYKKLSGHKVWQQISQETQNMNSELSRLGATAFAISDMWLLYYAAKDNYPCDQSIKECQLNLREKIILVLQSNFIDFKKKMLSVSFAFSYFFTKKILTIFRI